MDPGLLATALTLPVRLCREPTNSSTSPENQRKAILLSNLALPEQGQVSGARAKNSASRTSRYRPASDERVAVVVCGANCDPATVAA